MNDQKNKPGNRVSKIEPAEQAGPVWDSHNLADLHDEACDKPAGRGTRVMIETSVYTRIEEEARRRGVSPETLIQVWLVERLEKPK